MRRDILGNFFDILRAAFFKLVARDRQRRHLLTQSVIASSAKLTGRVAMLTNLTIGHPNPFAYPVVLRVGPLVFHSAK